MKYGTPRGKSRDGLLADVPLVSGGKARLVRRMGSAFLRIQN